MFAGGGTGGHLAPGIAVAEKLRRQIPDAQVRFVGSGRPVERQMLEPTGFELSTVVSQPLTALKRRPHRFLIDNWRAWRAACRNIRTERPAVVIGLGGFASVPMVLAARRYRVPVVLLEQNAVPGRANRWLARRSPICLTFKESSERLPGSTSSHLTGNPVRDGIVALAAAQRKLRTETKTLLILGGSLGSRQVNESVFAAVETLNRELSGWKLIHQTGPTGEEESRDRYSRLKVDHEVAEFFPDLAKQYSQATLVVARAGATTLAELAALGLPAILIPYPTAVDDHQRLNARPFERAGAAVIVESANRSFSSVDLVPALKGVLDDPDRLRAMSRAMRSLGRPDATGKVAELILAAMRPGQQGTP